jgi:hypothetical protein
MPVREADGTGHFLWPSPADALVTISSVQLGYLLEVIDWRMPQHLAAASWWLIAAI